MSAGRPGTLCSDLSPRSHARTLCRTSQLPKVTHLPCSALPIFSTVPTPHPSARPRADLAASPCPESDDCR